MNLVCIQMASDQTSSRVELDEIVHLEKSCRDWQSDRIQTEVYRYDICLKHWAE